MTSNIFIKFFFIPYQLLRNIVLINHTRLKLIPKCLMLHLEQSNDVNCSFIRKKITYSSKLVELQYQWFLPSMLLKYLWFFTKNQDLLSLDIRSPCYFEVRLLFRIIHMLITELTTNYLVKKNSKRLSIFKPFQKSDAD